MTKLSIGSVFLDRFVSLDEISLIYKLKRKWLFSARYLLLILIVKEVKLEWKFQAHTMCFVNPFCTNSLFYFHACKYCVSDATEYWKTQLKGNIGTKLSKNSLFCLCLFKAPFLFWKSFYFLQLKLIRKYFRNVGQISTSVLIYRLLQKIIAPQPTFMRHSHFYLD